MHACDTYSEYLYVHDRVLLDSVGPDFRAKQGPAFPAAPRRRPPWFALAHRFVQGIGKEDEDTLTRASTSKPWSVVAICRGAGASAKPFYFFQCCTALPPLVAAGATTPAACANAPATCATARAACAPDALAPACAPIA